MINKKNPLQRKSVYQETKNIVLITSRVQKTNMNTFSVLIKETLTTITNSIILKSSINKFCQRFLNSVFWPTMITNFEKLDFVWLHLPSIFISFSCFYLRSRFSLSILNFLSYFFFFSLHAQFDIWFLKLAIRSL